MATLNSNNGSYDMLHQAHEQALLAAHGDSNDDEIAAWRETAELAMSLLPDYQPPTIDDVEALLSP